MLKLFGWVTGKDHFLQDKINGHLFCDLVIKCVFHWSVRSRSPLQLGWVVRQLLEVLMLIPFNTFYFLVRCWCYITILGVKTSSTFDSLWTVPMRWSWALTAPSPRLPTRGTMLFILPCAVYSFLNFLTGFSLLTACFRVSISQGSSRIPLLCPRDAICFYTHDLHVFISHLDLFPKLHFHHSHCLLDTWYLIFQHHLKLNNFIAKFITSSPSSLSLSQLLLPTFLLRLIASSFSQQSKFSMFPSSWTPLSPLFSTFHQSLRLSNYSFIISLHQQCQRMEAITG